MSALDVLQRLSLLLALIGVAALFVASTVYSVPSVALGEVTRADAGETVAVTATVTGVRTHDGTTFLTLMENGTRMDAVAFDGVEPDVAAGERYRVEGRVNLYHGSLELVVEDVAAVDR